MGPLSGVRVVEMAGLAPVPFGGMILADLGADVVRIDRPGGSAITPPPGPVDRGKRSLTIDLKDPAGLASVRALAEKADVFVEGFRPGVAEKVGIGPADLTAANPQLVYVRVTGWGQEGPLAPRAGHDINYIGLTGALSLIGRAGERPVPPGVLLGDLASGGMLMAMGVMAALYERERSGVGQVIDSAIIDGASMMMAFYHGLREGGLYENPRGENLLDGGRSFYDTYETADGQYVSVGPIEPQFHAQLVAALEIDDEDLSVYLDPAGDKAWRDVLTAKFLTKTRDEWSEVFDGVDACVAPVLSPWEAHEHPHNVARNSHIDVGGLVQPAPAPRFTRTPADTPKPLGDCGSDAAAVVAGWA
ncbi:CoA transferase [Nocardiaceae bacterium YC2-7]|uniref:CoA transferase n=2 Tax=Antrihabitans stalactiti TaxID=2584121 RepID=A0A848KA18_9NOCA|nr:CaiB/BaiF CoA-transferase family protein [Antrihabitans stalactiti]NMN94308.1 CoA transferase [Antrihabitans stalactiti]